MTLFLCNQSKTKQNKKNVNKSSNIFTGKFKAFGFINQQESRVMQIKYKGKAGLLIRCPCNFKTKQILPMLKNSNIQEALTMILLQQSIKKY